MLHRHEGFGYISVWVYFCQLDILMWWICPLNSCICGSEEEEERRASLSIMSRLAVSDVSDVTMLVM